MQGQKELSMQNKLVKNSIWNSAGMITYFACQGMLTFVIAWLSDDRENVGNLALALNITNLFTAIALYNVRAFQVSDINDEYTDREYIFTRVITCVSSIIICAAFVFIVDFTFMQRMIIICYMVFRANESFIDVLHGIDQKHWKMEYAGISLAIRGILMLTVFVIFVWLIDLLPAIIGMAVVTTLVGILYDIPRTKKLIESTVFSAKKMISLLKRCFPLMIVGAMGIAIPTFARVSIERILGTEAIGAYQIVITPLVVIQICVTMLCTPMMKVMANKLKEKNKTDFVKIFLVLFAVIVGITLVFAVASYFLGEWGLSLIFDESIRPYAYLMPGAAIAGGLIPLLWFFSLVFSTIRDIKGLFFGNLIGLAICFATTGIFINTFGIIGANHVMNLSQGIIVLCLLIRLFWCLKKKRELFE
ncbi:MAG: oligosaccharide flippase family protein [Oscillospiraceae bacterium]|nr:oligosaccharide flippase family protein [Oscillospiraceae bacterium]